MSSAGITIVVGGHVGAYRSYRGMAALPNGGKMPVAGIEASYRLNYAGHEVRALSRFEGPMTRDEAEADLHRAILANAPDAA